MDFGLKLLVICLVVFFVSCTIIILICEKTGFEHKRIVKQMGVNVC